MGKILNFHKRGQCVRKVVCDRFVFILFSENHKLSVSVIGMLAIGYTIQLLFKIIFCFLLVHRYFLPNLLLFHYLFPFRLLF